MNMRKQRAKEAYAKEGRDKLSAWAKQGSFSLVFHSENFLKVDDVRYYPSTGTICVDGHPAIAEKGADAFIELIERRRRGHVPKLIVANWPR